jgi:hypothetical protein
MNKRYFFLIIFIEVILFLIVAADCYLENKSIPWPLFYVSFIVAVVMFELDSRIASKMIKNGLILLSGILLITLYIIDFQNDNYLWVFAGLVIGFIMGMKLKPLIEKLK